MRERREGEEKGGNYKKEKGIKEEEGKEKTEKREEKDEKGEKKVRKTNQEKW